MTTKNIFLLYWRSYGGFIAIIRSQYFWISIFFTLVLFPAWLNKLWWIDVLAIIPGLLGFSLGGFAMWVAIGDEKFKSLIAGTEDENEPSAFMEVNATFTHFILVQITAICYAILCKTYEFKDYLLMEYIQQYGLVFECGLYFFYFLGYFLFIYALLTALATVFALFRISSWYDDMKTVELKRENSSVKKEI
ncbi:MAG: hypothetical protein HRT44_09210 [Bdellovibrionales bacterium]|nr:hypothetical protein [Bdellovibrionales bacterium]